MKKHKTKPPWVPPKDAINAMAQSDIEDKDKEWDYRKMKLTEEDELKNFSYTSQNAHQTDLVQVLELKASGKLDYLDKKADGGCCTIC